jgi:hypothetical protein
VKGAAAVKVRALTQMTTVEIYSINNLMRKAKCSRSHSGKKLWGSEMMER